MSQNSIELPTSGTLSGLQAVTDINAALDTLNTKWSGASAPATAELGQEWLDTSATPNTLRVYDGADWVACAWIDAANHLWQPLHSGGLVAVGSITLDYTHVGKLIANNASGVTATFPLATSIPAGQRLRFIQQQGAPGDTFVLQAGGADTLRSVDNWYASSLTLSELGAMVEFESDGSAHWFQTGKVAQAVAAGLIAYFGATSPPSGWLACDGSAISRTTYAALWSAIGGTFGTGDGSTTFNLPDLRGEFIRGWDNGRGVDSGRGLGTWQADQFASHSHSGVVGNAAIGNVPAGGSTVTPTGNTSIGSAGGNETRPRNVALLACIKY